MDYDSATDTEEEEEQFFLDKVNNLKQTYTMDHFMNYVPTNKILKNNFEEVFNKKAGDDIQKFYLEEWQRSKRRQSSMMAFDNDGKIGAAIASIVFKHIQKNYTLDIFYENPELADDMIQFYKEKVEEKHQPKIIPKKSLRIFNWGTRSFSTQ